MRSAKTRGLGGASSAVDPRYYRPTEVDLLLGDPSKAQRVLGWKAMTPLEEMVGEMVAADRDAVAEEVRYRRLDEDGAGLAKAVAG